MLKIRAIWGKLGQEHVYLLQLGPSTSAHNLL